MFSSFLYIDISMMGDHDIIVSHLQDREIINHSKRCIDCTCARTTGSRDKIDLDINIIF